MQEETEIQGPGKHNQQKRPLHILDLPYDIAFVIFLLGWDPNGENEQHFPTVASHVCRLWRQYALETPSLWTYLTFRMPFLEIEKYRVWFDRSKELQFDLDIGWQPFERASIKHAKAIMRLVVPHIRRMRSLRVDRVPVKVRRLIFDRLDEAGCSSLETLHIKKEWYSHIQHSQIQRTFRPFRRGGAPQLKEVTLGRIPHEYFIHQFSDLRLLDIVSGNVFNTSAYDNAKTVQSILSLLPNLQTLRIDREFWTGGSLIQDMRWFQSTLPPIRHDSLQELALIAPQDDRDAIIASTILPSLRYLRADPESGLPIGACCLPILAQAAPNHPFPSLVNLRLAGGHNPDHPIGTVHSSHMLFFEGALAGLPQLELLDLEQVNFDGNKHLGCLARLCPQLKRLVLFCCSGFTLLELRSVIRCRGEVSGFKPLAYASVEDPWVYRLNSLVREANDQGDPESADFNVGISKNMTSCIVLVDNNLN